MYIVVPMDFSKVSFAIIALLSLLIRSLLTPNDIVSFFNVGKYQNMSVVDLSLQIYFVVLRAFPKGGGH